MDVLLVQSIGHNPAQIMFLSRSLAGTTFSPFMSGNLEVLTKGCPWTS